MATKTYGPQVANLVRVLCHYIVKYRGKLSTTIETVITVPAQREQVLAMFDAVVAACAILDLYYPREAS